VVATLIAALVAGACAGQRVDSVAPGDGVDPTPTSIVDGPEVAISPTTQPRVEELVLQELRDLELEDSEVRVYFEPDATKSEIAVVRIVLDANENVEGVTFIDQAQTLAEIESSFETGELDATITEDLVPPSFRFNLTTGDTELLENLETLRGVQLVSNLLTVLDDVASGDIVLRPPTIFFETEATEEQIAAVRRILVRFGAIEGLRFYTQAETFIEFQEFHEDSPVLELVTEADMPTSYRFLFGEISVEQQNALRAEIEALPGVRTVRF